MKTEARTALKSTMPFWVWAVSAPASQDIVCPSCIPGGRFYWSIPAALITCTRLYQDGFSSAVLLYCSQQPYKLGARGWLTGLLIFLWSFCVSNALWQWVHRLERVSKFGGFLQVLAPVLMCHSDYYPNPCNSSSFTVALLFPCWGEFCCLLSSWVPLRVLRCLISHKEPSLTSISCSKAQPQWPWLTLSNTCPWSPHSHLPRGPCRSGCISVDTGVWNSRDWDSLALPTLPGGTLGQ